MRELRQIQFVSNVVYFDCFMCFVFGNLWSLFEWFVIGFATATTLWAVRGVDV